GLDPGGNPMKRDRAAKLRVCPPLCDFRHMWRRGPDGAWISPSFPTGHAQEIPLDWQGSRKIAGRSAIPGTSAMAVKPRLATLACTPSVLALLALAALGGTAAFAQDSRGSPEAATGWWSNALATAKSHMVVAANPMATEAGLEILRAGGSAADAAV